jgi:tripartite-type tricarboxylate transporter receptor subunit TctC
MVFRAILGGLLGLLVCTSRPQAEDYPNRRLKFMVPHPAGAQVDALARVLGQRMSEMWGQPVVIENRPGANGNLGAQVVARSDPDGYTLMLSTNGPLTTSVALFRSLGFDPERDFDPIAIICKSSTLIASSLGLDVRTVADVVAMAKKEPGKLSMGTGGHGTGGHFTLAGLNKMAGVEILHVPYRGSVQANADLAGGSIQLVSSDSVAMLPLIQAGKIRALATAGAQRLAQLPDVPTVAETALPGFDVSQWVAVTAPRGTPADIVEKLNTTINAVLVDRQYKQKVVDQGCNPTGPMSPDAVGAFIRQELPLWTQRVRDAKLEVQ